MPDTTNHPYPYTPMTLGELHQKLGELLQQQIPETPTNVLTVEARDVRILGAAYQRKVLLWTLPANTDKTL